MSMILVENERIILSQAWIVQHLEQINREIAAFEMTSSTVLTIDAQHVTHLDTTVGQTLLLWIERLRAQYQEVIMVGLSPSHQNLLDFLQERLADFEPETAAPETSPSFFEKVGRAGVERYLNIIDFLAFIGEVAASLGRHILRPWQIRWMSLGANVERNGLDALLIVGLLNFLIGVVLSYQGGTLLRMYGANIFIVDMISISVLREMAPLITAIIVAGRTGSAFAAQIGTMIVNQEVDALRTIGINPVDQLVLPKLLGLVITLPLLTLFGNIMGVFGGMVLANFFLEISFSEFMARIPQVMTIATFWVGILKTPVFAMIIVLTGCFQGFKVKGGADSVGKQTTSAVVNAIFLVILADALFSILTRNVPL